MKHFLILTVTLIVASTSIVAQANSVNLLVQGRTELVSNLLDKNLDAEARLEKLAIQKQSQRSIEQLVARDSSLDRRNQQHAKLLADFEKTFLIHASQEANRSLGEHWFHTVGLSSASIQRARAGRR